MKLKKNIFDRLSLKKKINLNRQNKISDQLASQSEKNASLIKQIKELQSQRAIWVFSQIAKLVFSKID